VLLCGCLLTLGFDLLWQKTCHASPYGVPSAD
jgi:hypothetical protein